MPTALGIALFAAAKISAYTGAGFALRRVFPGTTARPLSIGLVRLGAGLALGLLYFFLWTRLVERFPSTNYGLNPFLVGMAILRLILWTTLIIYFCDPEWQKTRRVLACAVAGTALSFLLDIFGLFLAANSFLRKFPVC